MRHSLLNELPGFLPGANGEGGTGLSEGGNGAAGDVGSDTVVQGVDGGFGVENAMNAA